MLEVADFVLVDMKCLRQDLEGFNCLQIQAEELLTDIVNPIALRSAKIVCNFGLSECNRVNNLQLAQSYEVLSMRVLSGFIGEIPY